MKYFLMILVLLAASISVGNEEEYDVYVTLLEGFDVNYGIDDSVYVPVGNMKTKEGVIFNKGGLKCSWKMDTDFPGRDGIYVNLHLSCSTDGSDFAFEQLLINCKYVTELRRPCSYHSTLNIESKNKTEHRIHASSVYTRLK